MTPPSDHKNLTLKMSPSQACEVVEAREEQRDKRRQATDDRPPCIPPVPQTTPLWSRSPFSLSLPLALGADSVGRSLSLAHSPRLSRSHPAHTAAKSGSRTVNHHRRCLPAQHLGRVGIGGTTVAVVNLLVLLTSSVQQFSVLLSTPFLIDLLLTQNRSEALDIRRAHVILPLNS